MPNRLAKEASPYLLQHAQNPVDWFPWGEEALSRARAEDKPILLSIGYSACHWCHVMERESFEDEAIARRMNELFVNVKVDREERPDLDQIYQLTVQLLGRSGGWPLTVFLTPAGKPFFGGTYFPPVDRHGMPGFPKILDAIADAYRSRRGDVDLQAAEMAEAIAAVASPSRAEGKAGYVLGADLLERAVSKLSSRFDDRHGGFGQRPKFPNTMCLDVLLRRGALEGDQASLDRVRKALDGMRDGGIHDQLGGGFHRYSTDERWLVPHFEKMLYDNALLLRSYVDGFRIFGDASFAEVARGIVGYLAREMRSPGGGFYATEDADSEGEEGKFFVWTPAEVKAALGADTEAVDVARLAYGITEAGNFEHTAATVLHRAQRLEDVAIRLAIAPSAAIVALERARVALFAARENRVRPFRDEKILASWNALLVSSLADGAGALGEPSWLALAEDAYAHVRRSLVVERGADLRVLRHEKDGVAKGPGFLDDQAFLANAALDLHEATGRMAYLDDACRLADTLLACFRGPDGRLYFTPEDGEALIARPQDPYDHAIPSGASIAHLVLLRLGAVADEKYAAIAAAELEAVAPAAMENPFGFGQTLGNLDRLVRGSIDVVLVGDPASPEARTLAAEAHRAYLPNRNLLWVGPTPAGRRLVLAEGKPPSPSGPVAYVCQARTCSPPVTQSVELAHLLAQRSA